MKYLIAGVLCLIAGSAFAESPAIHYPSPTDTARAAVLTLQVDKNNLEIALIQAQQAVEALAAQNAALTKHQADLDAYLAACGDRPGCTQPIAKAH